MSDTVNAWGLTLQNISKPAASAFDGYIIEIERLRSELAASKAEASAAYAKGIDDARTAVEKLRDDRPFSQYDDGFNCAIEHATDAICALGSKP